MSDKGHADMATCCHTLICSDMTYASSFGRWTRAFAGNCKNQDLRGSDLCDGATQIVWLPHTFVATVLSRFPFDLEHPELALASAITSASVARSFWFFAAFLCASRRRFQCSPPRRSSDRHLTLRRLHRARSEGTKQQQQPPPLHE